MISFMSVALLLYMHVQEFAVGLKQHIWKTQRIKLIKILDGEGPGMHTSWCLMGDSSTKKYH